MILLRTLDDFPDSLRGGAVAIGNFDGVHLGHARLVERLRAMAERVGGPAVVFTFDPSPTRVLRPDAAPEPLLWPDRKIEILAELGADAVLVYPTDKRFWKWKPGRSSTAWSATGWRPGRWSRGRTSFSAAIDRATSRSCGNSATRRPCRSRWPSRSRSAARSCRVHGFGRW